MHAHYSLQQVVWLCCCATSTSHPPLTSAHLSLASLPPRWESLAYFLRNLFWSSTPFFLERRPCAIDSHGSSILSGTAKTQLNGGALVAIAFATPATGHLVLVLESFPTTPNTIPRPCGHKRSSRLQIAVSCAGTRTNCDGGPARLLRGS